jgi:hypothetical protein
MEQQLLSKINRVFKEALTEPVIALYHYNGCGFFDGGCLLLAHALHLWSKESLKMAGCVREIIQDQTQVDHWFVTAQIGGKSYYLDANGLMKPAVFLRYWMESEGLGPILRCDNPEPDQSGEAPWDPSFSALLATQIEAALGPYTCWLEQVSGLLSPQQPGQGIAFEP